jgi:hypothetical protein
MTYKIGDRIMIVSPGLTDYDGFTATVTKTDQSGGDYEVSVDPGPGHPEPRPMVRCSPRYMRALVPPPKFTSVEEADAWLSHQASASS